MGNCKSIVVSNPSWTAISIDKLLLPVLSHSIVDKEKIPSTEYAAPKRTYHSNT